MLGSGTASQHNEIGGCRSSMGVGGGGAGVGEFAWQKRDWLQCKTVGLRMVRLPQV